MRMRQALLSTLSKTLAGFVTARQWLGSDHAEFATREACEKRITEAENRCFSAGRNVFHYLQSPIDFCSRR